LHLRTLFAAEDGVSHLFSLNNIEAMTAL